MLCQEMNDFHFLSQESCMTGAFACFQSGLRTCFAITYIKEMMKGETGDDGTAKFTDLKDGIYLVVQTGSSGKAKDFTNVQPFLVIIPQFENGIQNRVVNAKPKTEIQRKEKPEIPPQTPPDLSPKKRPQTGDITNMFRWNGVLMLSSGMLLLFFRIRQKSKIGEESVDEKE